LLLGSCYGTDARDRASDTSSCLWMACGGRVIPGDYTAGALTGRGAGSLTKATAATANPVLAGVAAGDPVASSSKIHPGSIRRDVTGGVLPRRARWRADGSNIQGW